jgi:hypothetical protein
MDKRRAIAMIACGAAICALCAVAIAQTTRPQIFRISSTTGPEGSRVVITGENLREASAVFFGISNSTFSVVSAEQIVTLVPHKSVTSNFTVVTPRGSALSPFAFVVSNDPRVPDEVSYKAGYVNAVPLPREFRSALLWGSHRRQPRRRTRIGDSRNRLNPTHMPGEWRRYRSQPGQWRGSRWTLPPRPMVRHGSARTNARDLRRYEPCGRTLSRPAPRSRLAFLECLASGRAAIRQPRGLYRESPREGFVRSAPPNRDGLLA